MPLFACRWQVWHVIPRPALWARISTKADLKQRFYMSYPETRNPPDRGVSGQHVGAVT